MDPWHTCDNNEPPPPGRPWGDGGVEAGWGHVSWMRSKSAGPGSGRTGRMKIKLWEAPAGPPFDPCVGGPFEQFSLTRPSPTDVLVDNLVGTSVGVAGSVSIDLWVNQACGVWAVRSWGSGTNNPNQYFETWAEAFAAGPFNPNRKRFDAPGNVGTWSGLPADTRFDPWLWSNGELSSFLIRSDVPDAITRVCILGYSDNQ